MVEEIRDSSFIKKQLEGYEEGFVTSLSEAYERESLTPLIVYGSFRKGPYVVVCKESWVVW